MNTYVLGKCLFDNLNEGYILELFFDIFSIDNPYRIIIDHQGIIIEKYTMASCDPVKLNFFLQLIDVRKEKLITVDADLTLLDEPEIYFEVSQKYNTSNSVILFDLNLRMYPNIENKIKYQGSDIYAFSAYEIRNLILRDKKGSITYQTITAQENSQIINSSIQG